MSWSRIGCFFFGHCWVHRVFKDGSSGRGCIMCDAFKADSL